MMIFKAYRRLINGKKDVFQIAASEGKKSSYTSKSQNYFRTSTTEEVNKIQKKKLLDDPSTVIKKKNGPI